jgi:hypothetical protein
VPPDDRDDRGQTEARGRLARGERLGGFIYGTIVALSVVIAGAKAFPTRPGHIALVVVVTTVVFWLAHVYAHGLAHSVATNEHLSLAELRRIAWREGSILEAGALPAAALLAGALGIVSASTAGWIAFGLGMGVLAAQGLSFARVERLSRLGTLVVVALNLGLGVVLIALKLFVSHH